MTPINQIFSLVDPMITGKIVDDYIPHTDFDLNQLRRKIGFVTQDIQLFSGTIKDIYAL
jgi:ATP-binding cassette subfamily B protein